MLRFIQAILETAVYAASGDNSQPWRFSLRGNRLRIWNLPDRDLPFYNFRQSGSYVAHGGLIENILLGAKHEGWKTVVRLFPGEENLVAEIDFEKSEPEPQLLWGFVKDRHTNRTPYDNTPLSDEEMRAILDVQKVISETRVLLRVSPNERQKLGAAVAANETIALEVPELHRDFFAHIVWTEKEEREKKSGLYLKTMELPLPLQWIFRVVRHPLGVRIANLLGFSKVAALGNAKLYATGGAIGIITTPKNTPEDFIAAGRALQRVWLEVTRLGLHMQPLAGLLFLIERMRAGEDAGLLESHREMMRAADKTIRDVFGLDSAVTVPLLFRIGRGAQASARSSRMPPQITQEPA